MTRPFCGTVRECGHVRLTNRTPGRNVLYRVVAQRAGQD